MEGWNWKRQRLIVAIYAEIDVTTCVMSANFMTVRIVTSQQTNVVIVYTGKIGVKKIKIRELKISERTGAPAGQSVHGSFR